MKLTILGSGTSTGVPQIGCDCEVCRSAYSFDKRLRTSAIVDVRGRRFLIDCGPDFREQILRLGSPHLDAALLTHSHYDHVGGIDDLRPYCKDRNFPIYCRPDVAEDLRNRVPYCFREHPYPGVPQFDLHELTGDAPFTVDGIEITPLPVLHYKLPIIGFRIGALAYITDCKTMPAGTLEKIKGVDTLVINALRHETHFSHMNLDEAMAVINETAPRQAFLTHLSHDMGLHREVEATLPDNVKIAYDGLTVDVVE